MTRSLLRLKRQAGKPPTVREIAIEVGPELGLNMKDFKTLHSMTANVWGTLATHRDGIVCAKRPDGLMLWSINRG